MNDDLERYYVLCEASLRELLRIADESRKDLAGSTPVEDALSKNLRAQWCGMEQKARRLLSKKPKT